MNILLGILLPALILLTGAFFIVYLRALPLCRPKKLYAVPSQKSTHGISSTQALLTALAGTLGVGNISGVALAVTVGGAGALFWMWVCALFAMFVKYAEIVLSLATKQDCHGGAMYYLPPSAGKLFAVLCICLGFCMGNLIQVRAAVEAAQAVWHSTGAVPLFFSLLLLPILLLGKKGVFRFAERVIPFLCLGYVILSLAFLILQRRRLPEALRAVFSSAFDLRAAGGGLLGSGLFLGMRYGAVRGMLSNESGCGTAPIAHAACDNHPAAQGRLGMAEVCIDTLLLCTLTALVVLVSGQTGSGTEMVIAAFQGQFGTWGGRFLALSLFLFAFATTVCWFYYICECSYFLFGSTKFEQPLAVLYSLTCLGAGFLLESGLFGMCDLLLALLTLLNLPALWLGRKIIREQTEIYYQK